MARMGGRYTTTDEQDVMSFAKQRGAQVKRKEEQEAFNKTLLDWLTEKEKWQGFGDLLSIGTMFLDPFSAIGGMEKFLGRDLEKGAQDMLGNIFGPVKKGIPAEYDKAGKMLSPDIAGTGFWGKLLKGGAKSAGSFMLSSGIDDLVKMLAGDMPTYTPPEGAMIDPYMRTQFDPLASSIQSERDEYKRQTGARDRTSMLTALLYGFGDTDWKKTIT